MRSRRKMRRVVPRPGPEPASEPVLKLENEVVPLSVLSAGEQCVVIELAGGRGLLGRMASLGFTPGAEVRVLQNFGRGPIIARVRDARIALGRGEAGRVYVRRRSR
jgi:Fe2+ transport system protein FeoA